MRRQMALLAVLTALPLAAQCIVDKPGGSKVNINRPGDADVEAASFSPLEALDHALSKTLCFTAGYRARFEDFTSDSYLLTRFRLGALIRPTAWFRVYAELQDATAFWKDPPLAPPYQSTWDLRRAYADFGPVEESSVRLRIGRQDLNFGAGRLVGTSYWRNASRGYDAALLDLHWGWLRASAFASSPVVVADNGISHHQPGNNLHGIYGSLGTLIPGSAVEPYVFWRLSPGIRTEEGALARLDEKTFGMRWTGSASNLDYDAEVAGQAGHAGPDRISAWAWMASAGYTLRLARWKPRWFAEYDYASGDRDPKDGVRGTFDQLYPNIHDHHGLADQVAWQNLKEARTGLRVSLRRNWTLAGACNDWWLASARDAFYSSSGGVVARDARGLSGTHIGREFDAETSWRINRDLEFGAGIGRILPGSFLLHTIHSHAYSYPYIMLNYNFF